MDAIVEGLREAWRVMLAQDLVPPPPVEAYTQFNPEEFRVPSDIMPDSVAAGAAHDPLLDHKGPLPQS